MSAVPRNFKLLDELDKADHGQTHPSISLGLENIDDMTLTNWQASIIGPGGGNFDSRFYSLRVVCDESYPARPPMVSFITKVNLPGVN
jgi:ubiquitin-conjugating enzyme E2 variant